MRKRGDRHVWYCGCGEESVGECAVCGRAVCGYHSAFYGDLRLCDEDRTEAKHDAATEQQHARLAAESVTYIGFERAMTDARTIEDLERHVGMERDAGPFWSAVRRVLRDAGVQPDVELCELTVRVTAGSLSKLFTTAQLSVDERHPAWSILPRADLSTTPVVVGVHGGVWRFDPGGAPERVPGDRTAVHTYAVVAPPGVRLKLERAGGRHDGGRSWTLPGPSAAGGPIGSAGIDLRQVGTLHRSPRAAAPSSAPA